MNVDKKRDWGLIIAGVLVVVCALLLMLMPGLTLATITVIAGIAFLVSGIFDIVNWSRFHPFMGFMPRGPILYAVLDIIIGVVLIVHPMAFSGVIPWLIGLVALVLGVVDIAIALRARKAGLPQWGWALLSGVVDIVCGIALFAAPELLVYFLGIFVVMRGASLIWYGWHTGRVLR